MSWPEQIADVEQLEDLLSAPPASVVEMMKRTPGDVLVLGVAGKMGPTLARMAKRAALAADTPRRVIGVARFSTPGVESRLHAQGIETIHCELLDPAQLERLPDAPNVIYMAGRKFGATSNEGLTWAMNAYLPGMVTQRFRRSRIAAFSTGNIYGVTPVSSGGPDESAPLEPVGDYAMSCLGRERIFDYFSRDLGVPVALLRLNYACEMRYGVLVDVARKVWAGQPVDVTMGHLNTLWQGDANAMSLLALEHAASPPFVVNIAGPEVLEVRGVAEEFGRLMGKNVVLSGHEAPDALLSDGSKGHRLFGRPRVDIPTLIRWIADWTMRGGETLDKPTHFEVRDGKF
jgi:nucleoside-diphosphate-sugar epimerase